MVTWAPNDSTVPLQKLGQATFTKSCVCNELGIFALSELFESAMEALGYKLSKF